MTRRRYAVFGAGAIGALYGARLAAAGHEVHFVLRSALDHVRAHGLRVESVYGDVFLARPSVHADPSTVPAVDVVLVGLKTTHDAALAELLPALAGPGTVVVVLQNGLGVEARAASLVPGATVLGGLCFTCSNQVGPGHVRHLDYGAITLGEHRPDGDAAGLTPAVAAVTADLEAAGVEMHPTDDLGAARWRKLVWNVPFNGLSVVLDAGTDELVGHPDTEALVGVIMDEVIAAAAAVGHPIPASTRDELLDMTRRMRPYATSMKLDADAGRPLEVEAIHAAPAAAARHAGCPMPSVEVLRDQLRFLDARGQRVASRNQADSTARNATS